MAACAVFELWLRGVAASPLWRVLPLAEVALYGPDPGTGYRHRPSVSGVWLTENRARIATSTLGLRDRERPAAKPSGALRVLVIGDSVIEALQVDLRETAVFVAERRLAERRPNTEIVNLGLAGATPAVQVARLGALGMSLQPDLVVLVTALAEISGSPMRDDRDFPGYRQDGQGRFALSYRFRESGGYRFRTSSAGQIMYWGLDRLETARALNARKNVGMLAEWHAARPAPAAVPKPTRCPSDAIEANLALWSGGEPTLARRTLDALLRDLGEIAAAKRLRIVLALRGIGVPCAETATRRADLVRAIEGLIGRHGLGFEDIDRRVFEAAGRDPVAYSRLQGFGAHLGGGHLNVRGNAVYGAVFAEIIDAALGSR